MDEHQVSMAQIDSLNTDEKNLGGNAFSSSAKRQSVWISGLALPISKMNDCVIELEKCYKTGNMQYVFKGYIEDTQVCEFMLAYLTETARRSYEQQRKALGLSGRSDKNDFLMGFSTEVRSRLEIMIEEREEKMARQSASRALVVSKKVAVESAFGKTRERTTRRSVNRNMQAYQTGRDVGGKVHLGKSVTSNSSSAEKIA